MNGQIQQLSSVEIDEVAGGGLGGAVVDWLVGKALDTAVSYVKDKAPGGADQTTWTNVGYSQMGA